MAHEIGPNGPYRFNAVTGTEAARQIVRPLLAIPNIVYSETFDFIQDLHLNPEDVTFRNIKCGMFSTRQIEDACEWMVRKKSDSGLLRDQIEERFRVYEANVRGYVGTKGIEAFLDLYIGNFAQVNGQRGMGIGEMLSHMTMGALPDGNEIRYPHPEEARERHQRFVREVNDTNLGPLADFLPKYRELAQCWVRSKSEFHRAQIIQLRRDMACGSNGILHQSVMRPAQELTWELEKAAKG